MPHVADVAEPARRKPAAQPEVPATYRWHAVVPLVKPAELPPLVKPELPPQHEAPLPSPNPITLTLTLTRTFTLTLALTLTLTRTLTLPPQTRTLGDGRPPAAEAPGRRLQAMPDADGRAACRDRGPRRHGRGHARQLVPEPPCAAGVGCAAAAGELIEHALHVLQGGRGQRRRRRRSSNEVAAVACAFELCLNGRFGAAMLGRGARCCAEDRDCESRR